MGYRTYIGKIEKTKYDTIKSMGHDELLEHYGEGEEGYVGVYELGDRVYEFGKYDDFDPPKGCYSGFFENTNTQSHYSELSIVNKFFLQYIIDGYANKVKEYYNEMCEPFFKGQFNRPSDFLNTIQTDYKIKENDHTFDFTQITQEEQNALFKIFEHMKSMRSEWDYLTPYNLKMGEHVTNSSKYEYSVFELTRIYKTFDWDKYYLYFYGY